MYMAEGWNKSIFLKNSNLLSFVWEWEGDGMSQGEAKLKRFQTKIAAGRIMTLII